MERGTVAVEDTLRDYAEVLREKGYDVQSLGELNGQSVIAVIISGGDENTLGMEDINTSAPVIDARGQTPEEIVQAVERALEKV